MIPGLGLAAGSAITQRILSQSNNIGYAARGVYRVDVVPEDRKAEYLFRDFVMTFVMAYLTELSFRITEVFYTIPNLTKILDFPKLDQLYLEENVGKNNLHGAFKTVKNQKWFPSFVQKRLLGSLVKDSSNNLVPELMLRELSDKVDGKWVIKDAHKADEALIHHLFRRLNFEKYLDRLEKMGNITTTEREAILAIAKKMPSEQLVASLTDDLAGGLDKLTQKDFSAAIRNGQNSLTQAAENLKEKPVKKLFKKAAAIEKQKEAVEKLESKAASYVDDVLKEYQGAKPKVQTLVDDFLHSEAVKSAMKTVQKSASWPKMAVSVGLSLIFYGIIANKFDVEKLQPWQEKLFKDRGTSREVIKPAYQALVPGILTTVALMSKKSPFGRLTGRLGYIGSFAVAGFAGLVTYAGSWYALYKKAIQKAPPIMPKEPSPLLYGLKQGQVLKPLRRAQLFAALENQQGQQNNQMGASFRA